tara:strand:- start:605 stop:1042 length:438 start_codon:yes stop_codon:yes gene_type:complete
MGIFNFLFSDPKLVSETKKQAKILFKEYETFRGVVGQNSVKTIIAPEIYKILNNRKKHIEFENHLIENEITTDEWLLSSVCAIANHAVSSGHHHMHLGTLNPMTGADTLLPIFIDAQKKLVNIGKITQELADENIKIIRQNIASC